MEYNRINAITPRQIEKAKPGTTDASITRAYVEPEHVDAAADPVVQYMSKDGLLKSIDRTRKAMEKAAKDLDFIEASRYRDEMYSLEKILHEKFKS
jgi:excinuclease ABC subunit B